MLSLWFDTLLILVIIGTMLAGFADGFVLQMINLAAFYLGLAMAAAYQTRISRIVEDFLGPTDSLVRDTVIFVIIVFVIWGLVNLATRFGFESERFRTGQTIDRLGGLVLGLVMGFVAALMIVLILSFVTSVPWPDYNGLRNFLVTGLDRSLIRRQLLSWVPLLVEIIRPWVPGYVPPIFFPG